MRVRRPRPRRASCLAAAGAVLVVTACSAAPAAAPSVGVPEPVRSAAVLVHEADHDGRPGVVLRSRITRIAGDLSDVRRERVARRARAAVKDYLDAAFAGNGERPFRRFQAGLRRAARTDRELLAEPGDADVARAAAWFAVAAPGGRPVGITARLRVDLAADGGPATALTGRLLLTRVDGTWRVFGYDLARGAA